MALTIHSIEQLATLGIRRGCQYAILAIFALAISLSSSMSGACEFGACLFLIVCAFLVIKALRVRRGAIENTELWSLLDETPRADVGQRVLGPLLRSCYLEFALHMARLSAMLMAAAIAISLAL